MAKKYIKKPDLNTRVGKYFLAKQKGMTKKDAQIVAGFSDVQHPDRIEKTQTYKAIEQVYYADELLKLISKEDIAKEQVKVIIQDRDLSAKNNAIKQALEKVEPEDQKAVEDRVVVVLR